MPLLHLLILFSETSRPETPLSMLLSSLHPQAPTEMAHEFLLTIFNNYYSSETSKFFQKFPWLGSSQQLLVSNALLVLQSLLISVSKGTEVTE